MIWIQMRRSVMLLGAHKAARSVHKVSGSGRLASLAGHEVGATGFSGRLMALWFGTT
jgi:hypothetical protein